jgi:von Willebrand factor type A domain
LGRIGKTQEIEGAEFTELVFRSEFEEVAGCLTERASTSHEISDTKGDSMIQLSHGMPAQRFKLWVSGGVSVIVHTLLLLVLAFLVITGQSITSRAIVLTVVQPDDVGEQHNVDFEISSMTSSTVELTQSEQKQPSLATDVDLAPNQLEVNIETSVHEAVASFDDWRLFDLEPSFARRLEQQMELKQNARSSARSDASASGAAGGAVGIQGANGTQPNKPGGTQYFGTRAYGKKFVFVVDGSGSMVSRSLNGIRWPTATEELLRCLNDLRSDYEFFVICFNVAEYPIFDHYPPNNRYLKNDPNTLRLVEEWISQFHPSGNTYPSQALQMAIEMRPDAIFLLSDGEIRDDSIEMLRRLNRGSKYGKPSIPIHTILLMSELGKRTLQTIAKENGGKFRNVTYQEWLAARVR